MVSSSRQKQWVAVSALGLVAGACFLTGWPKVTRANLEPSQARQPSKLTKIYFGTSACSGEGCHSRDKPLVDKEYPPLCRCTEMKTWEQDKHKNAYNVLLGDRANNMGKLLKKNVAEESSCLACHGIDKKDPTPRDKTFKVSDGVSCVVCHGADEKWVGEHQLKIQASREKWRKRSRQNKQEDSGMTDLWDPVNRTKLCASCHIGNAGKGKVVTHAMYAAGHPPLPGLEVATFSDAMPRHWEYLPEKLKRLTETKAEPEVQKLFKDYYQAPELERSKLVLVAAAVALREAMNLLADQADFGAKAKAPEDRSLDLAQFDCYACHHELKYPGWRQQRGYFGKPGRPQFRPWPTALIDVAILYAGEKNGTAKVLTEEFHKEVDQLRAAFDARPLGDLKRIAPAAQALAKWADVLAQKLDVASYDQAGALRLVRYLCQVATSTTLDYDSARQLAWAFAVVYHDLPKPANDASIREQLEILKRELKLDLPSGTGKQILGELEESLQKLNDYRPQKFQEIFRELSKCLAQK